MPYITDSAVLATPISANKGLTSHGYLAANNALIARTGVQYYLSEELGLKDEQGRPVTGKTIKVYRMAEDVNAPEALRSIESAPITDDHPEALEGVTLDNHSFLAKGHGRNIRMEGDHVVADLIITDATLIKKVQDGHKVQISLGYTCGYEPHKDGFKQTNIRVNHIAVVTKGRAGSRVRIYDSQQKRKKTVFKNQKEFQSAAVAAFLKDATPEEIQAALPYISTADAAPAVVSDKANEAGLLAKLVGMLSAKPTKDAEGDDDKEEKKEDKETKDSKIFAALDALTARFDALESKVNDEDKDDEDEEEKKTEDSDSDEDDEDEKKKTEDASFEKAMKDMKPILAKMPEKQRKQVKDAFRQAMGKKTGGNAYAEINKTILTPVRDSAKDDPEALGRSIFEQCNPHAKKQA